MEYNIKLSKGKININGKEYDIPDEVAEFIIYETSTRDDIIQTRDVYKRTIDKAIELLGNYKHYSTPDEKQNSENEDLVNNAFDILKEVE